MHPLRRVARVVRVAALLARALPVLSLPAVVRAQSPAPIVGSWNIEWESGRQITNGETIAVMAKGLMKVEVSGDSLLATVTMHSRSDGQPVRPPFSFGGRRTDKGASFTQISEATLSTNGEERKQRSVGTWVLDVQGDQVSGQIRREIEGLSIEIPPAAVKGARVN
jgi:hypothetical protein